MARRAPAIPVERRVLTELWLPQKSSSQRCLRTRAVRRWGKGGGCARPWPTGLLRAFRRMSSPASLSSPGLRGPEPPHGCRGLLGAGFTPFTFFTWTPGPRQAQDFPSSPSPASLRSPRHPRVKKVKRVKGRLESPVLGAGRGPGEESEGSEAGPEESRVSMRRPRATESG
jgi:hypothetical protein